MNIFDTLVRGKGCINEENITSFLAYLLDPTEDHDLKNIFLNEFLKLIGMSESEIESLSTNDIEIELEYSVEDDKEKRIDIVIKTKDHVIAIENKISEQSKQKNQLQEEYDGLKKDKIAANTPIIMCYLVPENKGEKITIKDNDKQCVVLWSDIMNELTSILQQENSAEINPINDYVKHTLKAFINFMNSTLKPKYFSYNSKEYRIYKYTSGQIIIEKETTKDNWKCVSARDILRHALDERDNKNYKYNTTKDGHKYTTRVLGAKLYKLLP